MDKFKSYIPLNFDLMSNPINWIIIALMVILAGVAASYIFTAASPENRANNS